MDTTTISGGFQILKKTSEIGLERLKKVEKKGSYHSIDTHKGSKTLKGKNKVATPKRSEIIKRAMELYHNDNYAVSSVNPTVDELRESGYIQRAMTQLMRVNPYVVEADPNESLKEKKQSIQQSDTTPFNVGLALKSGTFVSGGRGTGKSNLAKQLVEKLMQKTLRFECLMFRKAGTFRL
ncbi:MAG: hypothetical protein U9O89_01270 [Thermoproteota archaeon]|nr:hypothetical protein [Thermoproteota archaeon]